MTRAKTATAPAEERQDERVPGDAGEGLGHRDRAGATSPRLPGAGNGTGTGVGVGVATGIGAAVAAGAGVSSRPARVLERTGDRVERMPEDRLDRRERLDGAARAAGQVDEQRAAADADDGA